jgi:hypothetical protein
MIFTVTMYNTITADTEQQQEEDKYLMFLQNLN